jgi:hypothetical protein
MSEEQAPEEIKELEVAPTILPAPPEFSEFYAELPKLIPSHELQRGIRLLKNGVFVDEELETVLFSAYESWVRKQTSESISGEKIRRRLYGNRIPEMVYVLDGNRVLCGTVLNGGVVDPNRSPIARYPVPPISATNSFHPRDRVLGKVEGLRSRITNHEGFIIEIQSRSGKLEFDEQFLVGLVQTLRNSKRLAAEYPIVRGPIRDSLSIVKELLDKAQQVEAVGLVPTKFQKDESVRYLRSKGVTIIADQSGRLVYCYESKGRGLSAFIRAEAAKFGVDPALRAVPGFDGKSNRPQFLGKLWKKGHSYHLHIKAYYSLLKDLERGSDPRFKLSKRYSVNDVVFRLSSLFSLALYESELVLLPILGRYRQTGAKYFRNGDWVFVVTDKNVVTSCFKSREPLPAQPELEKLLKERSDKKRRDNRQQNRRPSGQNNRRRGPGDRPRRGRRN